MANRRTGRRPAGEIKSIDVNRIQTRPQTRQTIDSNKLQELVENIRKHGQLSPGKVFYDESLKIYVVVFGHRRYEACKILGIPFRCEVLDRMPTEAEIIDEQVIENEQRADLNPLERARAYARAIEVHGFTTQKQLAEHYSVSEGTITTSMKILELPEDGQRRIANGESVKAVLASFEKKPRRKSHGKKRPIAVGGGRTVLLLARRPIDTDEMVREMLRLALAQFEPQVEVELPPALKVFEEAA